MKQTIAVVVGVGPGLGSALVRCFLAQGMTVVAVARNTSRLSELKAEADAGRLLFRDCDVTQPTDVAGLFQFVDENLGLPDLVVFNAGAFQKGSVVDIDPEEFEHCWRVGCYGGFLVGQAAAKRMLQKQQGTIIFTGATASLRGGPGFVNLASPKFGLRALAQSMARELAPKNIHVAHVIIDGQIRSERYEHLSNERGEDSLLEPDQIAATYLALYRQHRSAWTHEQDLRPWVEKF